MAARIENVVYRLIAAVGLVACGGEGLAQTNVVADGNWSTGATWDSGEPDATTPAIINGGFTATIDQAGEVTNQVDLGTVAGETGSLNITGGDLTVSNADSAAFPSTIRVGQADGATGNLIMTDGTVAINGDVGSGFGIGDLLVGDVGTGTMTMSGGTFTAADEVFIGLVGPSDGTLNVSGGTLTAAGRNMLVGFFDGSTGALSLSGDGEVNVNDFLFTSFDPGATSNVTISGGTLNVGLAVVLGRNGNSSFTHSGGVLNITTDRGNGDFVVGDNGPNNTYDVSATAEVNVGRDFLIATFADAGATVDQSGGTIDIGRVARVGIDGVGAWNISGGTVNVGGSAWLGDFDTSHGTLHSSGGTLTITGDLSVGGALASNAPPMPVGTEGQALDADGTLIVSGADGAVNIGGDLLANPGDHTRRREDGTGDNVSMVVFETLDDSGISAIDVAGSANLNGAMIDVDLSGGTFGVGSFFDLLTATEVSDNFLQAPDDVGVIHLGVVSGGNGEILRATLVPEPSAALLLGLAALAMPSVRRASTK